MRKKRRERYGGRMKREEYEEDKRVTERNSSPAVRYSDIYFLHTILLSQSCKQT